MTHYLLLLQRAKMQEYITLSVTEAELMGLIGSVKELIHLKKIVK
jgi:hypothetical protein